MVSFPFRRDGWFAEVRANFDQMGRAGFEHLQHSPLFAAYQAVAPDPEAFPVLMDKMGELNRRSFDWAEEVRHLSVHTMLVPLDADSGPLHHVTDFYALAGGGLVDANWDGSARPGARLASSPD